MGAVAITLRALWSKAGVYLLAAAGIALALATIAAQIRRSAHQSERLKQADAKLKQVRRKHDVKANIDAISAADARSQLRARWGRR